MAWESRKRGGKYYVRKQRIGTRVISEYIGRGEGAALVAHHDKLARLSATVKRIRALAELEEKQNVWLQDAQRPTPNA